MMASIYIVYVKEPNRTSVALLYTQLRWARNYVQYKCLVGEL